MSETDPAGLFDRDRASSLRPGGPPINADPARGPGGEEYDRPMRIRGRTMRFAGMPADPASFGRDVAASTPAEVAEIIASGGFETPVQFCQSPCIHGWFARRTP